MVRILRSLPILVVAAIGLSVVSYAQPTREAPVTETASQGDLGSLQDRIAQGLATASPPADPTDARERDAASERLARFTLFLEHTGDQIVWGGFDAEKGFDLDKYRLTEFSPVVYAKLYLSTFMFPGPYSVRQEGKYTVLEVSTRFREGLDPGDYPYPFWHTPQKWQAYVDTKALLFVFENDRIVAAFREPRPTPDAAVVLKPWDGRWHWTDTAGHEQPRVTLFSYLMSADNPSLTTLDGAYRKLESAFRAQNCIGCHAPDNIAKASTLTLLNYPNQALVARHELVEVLRRNRMPPADVKAGVEAGIADETARQDLLSLAEEFEREANTALAYESARARADH